MTALDIQHTLFVQTAGSHLSLDGDAVRCYVSGSDSWHRFPLAQLDSIVLIGSVSASTDLLLRCADDQRAVHWLSEFGKPRATLCGPLNNHGAVRRAQHDAHRDAAHRNRIAATIVECKARNMRTVLRRAAHDATGHRKEAIRAAIDRITNTIESGADDSRNHVLGVEGACTRFYFTAIRHILRPDPGIQVPSKRTRRPASDPVNATLSMAYSLTRAAVHGAVHTVELDPATGFLHGDTDSQPALTLDLMEELRPAADHLVVTLFNRKQLRPEHYETSISGAVRLTDEGRRTLFAAWHEQRQASVRHTAFGRDIPHALVPLTQARLLARYLNGDTDRYLSYRM